MANLEYRDDPVLLSEDPGRSEILFDHLNNSVSMLEIRLYTLEVQNAVSKLNWLQAGCLLLAGDDLGKEDKFTSLGS